MKKRNNSTKNINPNRKFETGPELINKLDKLYRKSMINKNSSVKNMFFSGIKPFNSKQKSNPSYKSGVYSSIDSFKLKNFQKKNQSNIPPTIDVTDNYNSPIKSEINSNELNSAKKYKLKSELKTVFEIKNSKLKEIFNKDKKSISTDKQQSLSKKNSKKEENIKDNEGEKNLVDTDSEISLHSYKPEEKISPRLHHDYYSSFLDKNRAIRQERLLQSSIDFYLHQGRYRNQIINYKRECRNIHSAKKSHPFSELKRSPNSIAFWKIVPKESIKIQKRNKNKKNIIVRTKTNLIQSEENKNIFRTGLINNNSFSKLKEHQLIKDDYTSNNPGTKDYIPKDKFGNVIYPIFGQKKMLKNIMPKEYDYNIKRTPLELLRDTYHPLLRFQKKMLNQHINAINQEIGVTYSKYFTLVDKNKIPEKFQMCQELIDLQKDEKLVKLIRELIDRNFGLEKEVEKALDSQKKEKELARKKLLYRRFSEVMLKASIHFKRLNISLEDFYSIPNYIPSSRANNETKEENKISDINKDEAWLQKKIAIEKNGQYFFLALKAGDKEEILSQVNSNYFIMFYRDHFLQSPLHISAKRNLYKFISLFISRGADINAQDEGGRTALFIAAENNHLEFITVLLFEIADPSIKNCKGEKPFQATTEQRIKIILESAQNLHYYHMIGKIKQFNESIKKGLRLLYRDEMGINYEKWLKENEEIIKECEK